MFEHGRADSPVIANRYQRGGFVLTDRAVQQRGKTASDRARILRAERLADDAANVVFAQDGGVEIVAHHYS